MKTFQKLSHWIHFRSAFVKFERSKTGPPNILNFPFLILDSSPKGLNFCKQHDHKPHVFINPLVKRRLISQSQSNIFHLGLQIFILIQQPINLTTQSIILNYHKKVPFQTTLIFLFSNRWWYFAAFQITNKVFLCYFHTRGCVFCSFSFRGWWLCSLTVTGRVSFARLTVILRFKITFVLITTTLSSKCDWFFQFTLAFSHFITFSSLILGAVVIFPVSSMQFCFIAQQLFCLKIIWALVICLGLILRCFLMLLRALSFVFLTIKWPVHMIGFCFSVRITTFGSDPFMNRVLVSSIINFHHLGPSICSHIRLPLLSIFQFNLLAF